MLAVLARHTGLPVYDYDCFLNVVGGISVKGDPSADLVVCMSLASAYLDKPLPAKSVSIGEVGLLGDVRDVVNKDKRIKEARRLGYKHVITSKEVGFVREGIKNYLK